MQITVDSRSPKEAKVDLVAVALPQLESESDALPQRVAALDRDLGGALAAAVKSGDFSAKEGESFVVHPEGDAAPARVMWIGLGKTAEIDGHALRRLAGRVVGEAMKRKAATVALAIPRTRRVKPGPAAQALAEGAVLASYRFDAYLSEKKDGAAPNRLALSFERAEDTRAARAGARVGIIVAESQNVARGLSNEPPNELTPDGLARAAERVAKEVGLRCEVLDVAAMKKRKMGAILAVGQGSAHPPRMVVLEHNAPRGRGKGRGRAQSMPTIAVVGKGVTFDSGGISIKPSAAMDEMKHDMSGAAAVIGILRACALLKLPLHVVGVIGAAENLPSGTAYRPGDILTSMSKKTIEILNTDAEGRVVLADALHFARTEYEPEAMVDLATLTGACVIALGSMASGLFATDERLSAHLREAGEITGERAWAMPLWSEHRKAVASEVADVKNAAGREASSSTAAAFLAAFAGDTPWAHLDIAGTGWTAKPGPTQPRGATGVGVRLVVEALRKWKECHIV
jgi:leucyl aminopeptidase